jgi:AcrR family transcriptional regulator
MRDIATAAGVSVETIYSSQGSKTELLLTAVEAGVVGDFDTMALAERPEFAAIGSGSLDQRAAKLAELGTAAHRRTAGLLLALREAAVTDEAAARRLAELDEERRDDLARALTLITGNEVAGELLDGLWAISAAEVYDALTRRTGWTDLQYQTWATDVLIRLLQPQKDIS